MNTLEELGWTRLKIALVGVVSGIIGYLLAVVILLTP